MHKIFNPCVLESLYNTVMEIVTLYLGFGPCTEVHTNGYWEHGAAKIAKSLKLFLVCDGLNRLAFYNNIAPGASGCRNFLP